MALREKNFNKDLEDAPTSGYNQGPTMPKDPIDWLADQRLAHIGMCVLVPLVLVGFVLAVGLAVWKAAHILLG